MAITAAVVATAATVATTGMKVAEAAGAFGSSGGAGGAGAYLGPGLRERLFSRGTRDVLDAERSILDDSLAQGKLLEPEMYRALGLEPIYDRPEDTGYADASNALAQSQSDANVARARKAELQASRPGQGLRGKAKTQAIRGKKREMRRLTRAENLADKQAAVLAKDVEQRGAVGRRVVGFKPLAGVGDPTGSAGGAFGAALDSFNLHLSDALAGKEPLDPTLKSTFDERERTLRQRLMNQMGPDYETSTAGSQALANFDRERSEAYAQYNRDSITGYSALAEGRAKALSDLTTGRLKNLAFPASFRAELGKNLESSANERNKTTETMQRERGLYIEAAQPAQAAEQKAQMTDAAARKKALYDLAEGVGGADVGPQVEKALGGVSSFLRGEPGPAEGGPGTQGLLGAEGVFSSRAGKVGNLGGLLGG